MKHISPSNQAILYERANSIIENARNAAYHHINFELVRRNWMLGKLIDENELAHEERARYGLRTIESLSSYLTEKYGKGFSRRDLYNYLSFYRSKPSLFNCDNQTDTIVYSMSAQSDRLLSWTHYRTLLQENDPSAREWYEKEAKDQTWSVRTLQRNISSNYYHRLLASQRQTTSEQEIIKKSHAFKQQDPCEFIKNPVIGEFLGFTADSSFMESELEQAIISNLEKFILELGKGFAFVARQQHIHTEKEDYFIDLVFYNYILKSFVLIDLKTSKITHQDVGQMDMYVRMYDELKRTEGDNPTIGIVLCEDTDEDIARYSILHDSDHLFASKYMLYMPTQEQLRNEIERQKAIFYLQHK